MIVEPTTIEQEFVTIDFSHKSRNDRSVTLLKALFSNPQVSINAACDKWKDASRLCAWLKIILNWTLVITHLTMCAVSIGLSDGDSMIIAPLH